MIFSKLILLSALLSATVPTLSFADAADIDSIIGYFGMAPEMNSATYSGTMRITQPGHGGPFVLTLRDYKTEMPCRLTVTKTGTAAIPGVALKISAIDGDVLETWSATSETLSSGNSAYSNQTVVTTLSDWSGRQRTFKTLRYGWSDLLSDHVYKFGIQTNEATPMICAIPMEQIKR